MKQIYIILMITFSLSLYSQDCSIGNTDGTNSTVEDFRPNYLLGIKMSLSQEGTLTSINLLGNNTGANVRMALYDDNGGFPNNLIQESSGVVGSGLITLSVTPTLLSSGDYWIMALYDSDDGQSSSLPSSGTTTIYYQDLNFGDAMPSSFSSSGSYTGNVFDYSLSINCGNTLSIDDLNIENKVSLFPNPSSDFISISNLKSTESYLIVNQIGQKVKKGIISNNQQIDIRNFTNGLYFLKFDNGNTMKFIKE